MTTPALGDADIAAMLADIGVPFVYNSTSGKCVVDRDGNNYLVQYGINGVSGTKITAYVQTSAFAPLVNGASCTVDGDTWKIRDSQPFGDGAVTHVLLVKP